MAVAASFPTADLRSAPVYTPAREQRGRAAAREQRGRAAAREQRGRAAARTPLRLTRRGRIVLGIMLSVPFVAVLMVVGSWSADADTKAGGAPATGVVVVQAGQSLWEIAGDVAPESDPRATITAIRDLNGLGSDAVVPGQALVVPSRG